MNATAALALLPLLVLSGASVVAMLAIAIHRSHALTATLTVVGLGASFVCLWPAASVAPQRATALLVVDGYSVFYFGLLIAAAFAIAVLAFGYLEKQEGNREELYVLLLVATLGGLVLVASSHFASFFLGLEILTVSLYAMIAYLHRRPRPLEAGIKYLVLAAASAAFLLFGMALVYAELGTMELARMAQAFAGGVSSDGLLLPGLALIVTGIGFKLAVVPFHLWTPDVYEGAPAPVTAFVATVSKGAIFALLLRYFYGSGAYGARPLLLVFSVIAIASMIGGNVLALLQDNVKRILAYSSIAHMGYLLVAFLAGGTLAVEAVSFYLVAYFVTTIGAFGVIAALSTGEAEAERLEDYRGLLWRRPVLASVFTLMLLSLAGIPATAGFLGKFYVVAAGASSAIWALVIVLVLSSVIGLFYYLRIVSVMCTRSEGVAAFLPRVSATGGLLFAALVGLLVWFGVYPEPLLRLIQGTIRA